MGTLFDQKTRDTKNISYQELEHFIGDTIRIAQKHKVTVSDVIAAKNALELERQNNLFVLNGDTFDEQAAGFGELMKELIQALEEEYEGESAKHWHDAFMFASQTADQG